jgi:predicted ABC-type ATPase
MSDNNDKKLIIITGPQGSGNHLFSKIFNVHPDINGWDFGDKYWIPSDEEPFAECWVDPSKTKEKLTGRYMVANVSVPFVYDGVRQVPKIQEVADEAREAGYEVTIAIVCRDANINALQQKRVRFEITLGQAMEYYRNLQNVERAFLSHESLYLHKCMYLKWLSTILDFPIAFSDKQVFAHLEEDQNRKYVTYVEQHWLDQQVWDGLRPKSER